MKQQQNDDLVILTREEHEKLLSRYRMVEAFRAAGITNWEGLPLAMDIFKSFKG